MKSLPLLPLLLSLFFPLSTEGYVVLRLAETASGTAVDWSGTGGPYDVVRTKLSSLSAGSTSVSLGTVQQIECGSVDTTTRGGFEDPANPPAGDLFCYVVRGDSYGVDSRGYEHVPAAGSDCPAPPYHTVLQVCAKWNADYPTQAPSPIWTGDTTPANCDQGTLIAAAKSDGLRRTNLFRWLASLPDITENASNSAKDQAAVVIQRALGTLNHTPPSTAICYTADGYTGSSSSNLAAGYGNLASAVNGYMNDSGTASLGHRRWILYPPYSQGGFGLVLGGSYGSWMAQWVFSFGTDPNPPFVPYPSAAPHPSAGLMGKWSFSLKNGAFSSATVSVTRLSDNQPMTVSNVTPLANGYGLPTLSWDVAGVAAGQYYRVQIGGVTPLAPTGTEPATCPPDPKDEDGKRTTRLGCPPSADDLPKELWAAYVANESGADEVLSTYSYVTHIVSCP
jgi:hypothetical protein